MGVSLPGGLEDGNVEKDGNADDTDAADWGGFFYVLEPIWNRNVYGRNLRLRMVGIEVVMFGGISQWTAVLFSRVWG